MNLILNAITIVSFVVSIILAIRQSDFKKSLEKQLISVINNLDSLTYNTNAENVSKREVYFQSGMIRNQVIGILKTFSNKEERYKTFDFGINNEKIEERIKKRKESLGIDHSGCIVTNQNVETSNGFTEISELSVGDKITAFDLQNGAKVISKIDRINKYTVRNYLQINNSLNLTANHSIYIRGKEWTTTADLTIGDEIKISKDDYAMVSKIALIDQEAITYAIKVNEYSNLFVNGFLVHNEEEEEGK